MLRAPSCLLVLALAAVAVRAGEDAETAAQKAAQKAAERLAKAKERIRDLEDDIQKLIDKVSPAVGAVMNYAAQFNPATGQVRVSPRSLGSGTVVDPRGHTVVTNTYDGVNRVVTKRYECGQQ